MEESLDKNEAYFFKNKEALLNRYDGQWIAIREEREIMACDSLNGLMSYMYDNYGDDWNAYISEVTEDTFKEVTDPRALTF